MKPKTKKILIIGFLFLFLAFSCQIQAISPDGPPWDPPPPPSYGTTSNNFPSFDSGNTSSGLRCDHSVGGPGKDCYFDVDLSNKEAYQAYKWTINAVVDQVFNTVDNRKLVVEVCTTMGGWGSSPLNCWSFRSWEATDPIYAGWNKTGGEESNIGSWTSNATTLSFHIFVRNVYAHFDLTAYGRRAHIDSFTAPATVKEGEKINVTWSTTNVPNGGRIIGTGNLVEAGSYGVGPTNPPEYWFTAGNPGTATIKLQMQGPGGTTPPPTTVEQSISVNITALTVSGNVDAGWYTCTKGTTTNPNCDVPLTYGLTNAQSARMTKNGSNMPNATNVSPGTHSMTDANPTVGTHTYTLYGTRWGVETNLGTIGVTINPATGGPPGGGTTYILSLTKAGTGSGTVTSSPGGINCGTDCSESYAKDTFVTLNADAGSGSTFVGWGGACSGIDPCQITMNSDKSVTATFNTSQTPERTLTVAKAGSGTGTVWTSPSSGINCASDCSSDSDSFPKDRDVEIGQASASGSTFVGWGGACSGAGRCIVNMNTDKSVTATFTVTSGGGSPPYGSLDEASCTQIGGWAKDPDRPATGSSSTVDVEIHDGAILITTVTANQNRSDVGNHAFNIATPSSLKDGKDHSILAFAKDNASGPQVLLPGSPKIINCAPSSGTVVINITQNGATCSSCAHFTTFPNGDTFGWNGPKTWGPPAPAGSYSLYVPPITGFTLTISPSSTQTLNAGQSLTFNINYAPVGSCPSGTGRLVITTNVQTAAYWVTRPNGSVFGERGNRTYETYPIGKYSIEIESVSGYSNKTVTANPVSEILACNGTLSYDINYSDNPPPPPPPPEIEFTITYTPAPFNPPSNLTLDNQVCQRITLSWQDNSSGENGFIVSRSTTSGQEAEIARTPANAASYTDTPPSTNVNYFYVVQAFKNNPFQVSAASNEASSFNLPCTANLGNSAKTLSRVNNQPYSSSTILKDGDTLTFRITINNSGPAPATINYISDVLSGNLSNPRNMQVTGGGANGGITGTAPNIRLNVSGSKAVGNPNWTVQFDVTLSSTGADQLEQLSNSASINFTDGTGTFNKTVNFGPILFKTGKARIPNFREVAP